MVRGMQSICAIASTLLGGVATADGEATLTSTATSPSPTAITNDGLVTYVDTRVVLAVAGLAGFLAMGALD